MWQPETRVVAALSGGSDSVAMLLLLHDLHSRSELRLHAVAHLNHSIRPEAGEDEAFCRTLAERLSIPFVSSSVDVPAIAREQRRSIEVAARMARRAFLDDVRRSHQADCIAIAHTEDDQAETVLLRLLRGAGQRGLAGIAPCRNRRIRPVLCATREELRHEVQRRGHEWREDATNADVSHYRNRIRHELLPYVEQHFNPSARRALARIADVVRAEDDFIAREMTAAAIDTVLVDRNEVRLDAAAIMAMPEAIARRVVQHGLSVARHGAPTLDDVDAVMSVVSGARRAVDISALRAEHFRGFVVLVPRRAPQPSTAFRFDLPVPGTLESNAGWIVEAETFDAPQEFAAHADVAQIDAAVTGDGLIVRSRQPGDRIRPVGLGGSKKLQDVLVDRKVNRTERDRMPVVTDRQGRIVWVPGHVLNEEFRVTANTKSVIILKLRRI
jgi:tRNA(Ile)-lysidine synthase